MEVLTLDGSIRSPHATFTVFSDSDLLQEKIDSLGSDRTGFCIHYTSARTALIALESGMDLIGDDLNTLVFEKNVLLIQQKIESVKSIHEAGKASRQIFSDLDRLAHKKDVDTLLCIIENSKQVYEITSLLSKKYKKHDLTTTAKVSRMIKPNEVEVVDYKGLALNSSLALVAQMGAGKNVECIEPWFAEAMLNDKMPVYLAPLKSLLDKYVGTAEHYQSLIDTDSPKKGLRTTANSFVMEQYAELRKHNKILFIDEVVRLIEQVNGGAFLSGSMHDKVFGWEVIFDAIKSAETVVLADAQLGQVYLDIIKSLTGKEFPALTTPSSDYSSIKVSIGAKVAELAAIVKLRKADGVKSAYFFDGKIEDGKALEAAFIKAGLNAVYLYSSEGNVTANGVIEISRKPESLDRYDVVICSPYIGPGWACNLQDFKNVLVHCCGTVSPASVIQSIKRFRAVETVNIAYDLRFAKRNLPEKVLSVAFNLAANEIQNEAFDVSKTLTAAYDFVKNPNGKAICKMIALENYSRNNYEFFIHKAVQALGFDLEVLSHDVKIARSESKLIKKEKEIISEEKLNFFLNDQFLDEKKLIELRAVKRNKGVVLADDWLIEKSEAALLMNTKGGFTEAELDFILNKNGVELIKKCEILAGESKKTHANFVKAELFREVVKFAKSGVYNTESITGFFENLKSSKLKWNGVSISKFTLLTRTIFEMKGVAGGGYVAAKNILKFLGFVMSSSESKSAGIYQIDSSLFDMANRYVQKNIIPDLDLQAKNKRKMNELKAMIHEGKSARVAQHEALPA